jgi:hypothetical protein
MAPFLGKFASLTTISCQFGIIVNSGNATVNRGAVKTIASLQIIPTKLRGSRRYGKSQALQLFKVWRHWPFEQQQALHLDRHDVGIRMVGEAMEVRVGLHNSI